MDYVKDGERQGRSFVFFKAHCPCILPSLDESFPFFQSITFDLILVFDNQVVFTVIDLVTLEIKPCGFESRIRAMEAESYN